MVRSTNQHLVAETPRVEPAPVQPKQPYLAALRNLSDGLAGVEALFDTHGRVRTLTSSDAAGLFSEPFSGNFDDHASGFIAADTVGKALGLQHAELEQEAAITVPNLGRMVRFQQILTVGDDSHPVLNGRVDVFMREDGAIFQVNNSVRHGRKPSRLDRLIDQRQALEAARSSIGVSACACERAEFAFSAHNDRFDPVWRVTLTTFAPRKVVEFLVKATTGQVVFRTNKLRASRFDSASRSKRGSILPRRRPRPRPNVPPAHLAPVLGRSFLAIPDPNVAISKQVHDVILDALPDPGVLKNDNLVVYLGSRKQEVRCKSDGTFLYSPSERQFSAVITFFAIHSQMELRKGWGMKLPDRPIAVFVDDPSVRDNAYFDPEAYEIHLGIGSGLPGGLNKHIAYDLGVTWHENDHHTVYLQAPGQDLPGSEGGAIHESIADVLGDLLMDFWFRLKYASQLKTQFTVADVEQDPRIIGKYAFPPDGIRIQKNKARTPKDKTGEPHDDGLISGGAKADLLVAMVKHTGDVERGLVDFGKMTLAALALVPSHKVTFVDLLRAYVTADQQLFAGAYKALITRSFADHGIVLKSGGQTGRTPVIIIR